MITAVDFISVNVADQERAKRFYTDRLGLELVTDVPMGEPGGAKWIELRPPGARTKIVLNDSEGNCIGLTQAGDDD